MADTKITKTVVNSLRPAERDFNVWDSDLKGFGIRVRATGGKTYVVRYRAGSGRSAPVRTVTIAAVGKVTPDQARTQALQILADVVQGGDPAAQKAERRAALTVSQLIDEFMAHHVAAKRKAHTVASYKLVLDKHVRPAIGSLKVDQVTHDRIAKLHLAMRATPYAANRMAAVVSSMYSFAAKSGIVPRKFDNPAEGIDRFKEQARERYLSFEDYERLGHAIAEALDVGIPWDPDPTKKTKHAPKPENRLVKIDPFSALALRLIAMTGARLREILHLRWDEVDLSRKVLFLSDSKTGRKTISLPDKAVALLGAVDRVGTYVIAGENAGSVDPARPERPRADLKRPWELVTKRAGLDGLRIHDLRHGFAGIGATSGVGLTVVGGLLGHRSTATTARYSHIASDPLRQAANQIGGSIAAALGASNLRRPDQTDG